MAVWIGGVGRLIPYYRSIMIIHFGSSCNVDT